MKANPYISIKEKRLLTIFASIIFSLTLINLGWIAIEDYNNSVKEEEERLARIANGTNYKMDFKIYGFIRHDYKYEFRFFSLILLPFIFRAKKFIFSTTFTFLSFTALFYEFYLCLKVFLVTSSMTLDEFITYFAKPLDYLVFLLISLLLFWQISILLRILIQTMQRKPELP